MRLKEIDKKSRNTEMYLAYCRDNLSRRQLAEKFNLTTRQVDKILKKTIKKSYSLNSKTETEVAIEKILLRKQKIFEELEKQEKPMIKLAYYREIRKNEEMENTLKGLLKKGIEVKDSQVLIVSNIKGLKQGGLKQIEKKE